MSVQEVIKRLKSANRAEVARQTGLPYRYLRNLVQGEIRNPGSNQMDLLRDHFAKVKQ